MPKSYSPPILARLGADPTPTLFVSPKGHNRGRATGLAAWLCCAALLPAGALADEPAATAAQTEATVVTPATPAAATAAPPAQAPATTATPVPTVQPTPIPTTVPTVQPIPTPAPGPASHPAPVTPAQPVAAPANQAAEPAAAQTEHAQQPTPPPILTEEEAGPIREKRWLAVSGELGWNTLPGLGILLTYHPISEIALETGLGVSPAGYKTGLRVRWNLLPSHWTPTVGAGLLWASGSAGRPGEAEIENEKIEFKIFNSPFAQLVAGVNFTGDDHFFFSALAGYAFLLRDRNLVLTEGDPKPDVWDAFESVFGGGIVISLTIGGAV